MHRRRAAGGIATLAVLTLATGACSSGRTSTQQVAASEIGDGAVRHALEPVVARLGLQIQRLSVEKTTGLHPEYELSVYLRPSKSISPDAYAAKIAPVAQAVIPTSFAKYDDIQWVDVCQEQAGTPDGVDYAAPVTRLEVNRRDAANVDWDHLELADVLKLYRSAPNEVSLQTSGGVDRTRAWRAAAAQARPPA